MTAVSRKESNAIFPPGVSVIKTDYSPDELIQAFTGQDAAVCVLGPAGIREKHPYAIVDAAAAAHATGVKRLIIDDFGWGPDFQGLPEFATIRAERQAQWDYAKAKAEEGDGDGDGDGAAFTWTGITTGNPIDWVSGGCPFVC